MSEDIAGIIKDAEDHMAKTTSVTKEEFSAIRTGRANAAMFQGIMVEYYGAPTPLNQLASLQFPEARTIIVTPYDKTAMSAVETALRDIDPSPRHDRFELIDEGRLLRRSWRLRAATEPELKRLGEALRRIPGVVAYTLDPRDD